MEHLGDIVKEIGRKLTKLTKLAGRAKKHFGFRILLGTEDAVSYSKNG